MKWINWLSLLLLAFLSGCGADWFPENSGGGTTTTSTPPTLVMSSSPAPILAGTDATLTFTIVNGTGNPAHTGLGFTDTLPANMTATSAAPSQCGGTVTIPGGTQIIFTGGALTSGTPYCAITATVTATVDGAVSPVTSAQAVTNTSAEITGFAGGLQSQVTDQTVKVFPAAVSADATLEVTASNLAVLFIDPFTSDPNVDVTLSVDAANSGAVDATTVDVGIVAVDITGADIASTAATISGGPVTAGSIVPSTLNTVLVTVLAADKGNIRFWRITTVTVTP